VSSLDERAREFILRGGGASDEFSLLTDCMESGTVEALRAVQMLFEDMYGGITFNTELKSPAAWCLVRWGKIGLEALLEAADRTPTFKNQLLALDVLATLASWQEGPRNFWRVPESMTERIIESNDEIEAISQIAERLLRRYILSFEDDQDLLIPLATHIQETAVLNPAAIGKLVQAMAARWLAVRTSTLEAFEALLIERRDDEPSFQSFFENHPLMIDPMAFEVYSQPSIHGAKEPDFLVRRTDNTFLVVEIETPGKLLMTQSNQLSAEATHAIAQATDYADFLKDRAATIRQSLPSFRQPECLVVIGMEGNLSEVQIRALRLDNESRHHVKVVGFDWLAKRARSTFENIVAGGIVVNRSLRVA
jgi:hypothetical protein